MSELRRNTMVGAFTILGIAALGWLMTSFGEMPAIFGARRYEIRMAVNQPSGVGEGAPIYLSGVQIGRVKELRFKNPERVEDGVHIIGAIEDRYDIPRIATAVVQPSSLGIGRGHINIEVPEGVSSPPLAPGGEIDGRMGSMFGGIIPDDLLSTVETAVAQFGNFVAELTPVASDLHDLFAKHTIADVDHPEEARRLTANLYTVVQRFDKSLKTFNQTFGDPKVRAGWNDVFENVRAMSIDGRKALKKINKLIVELREDLHNLSETLRTGLNDANVQLDDFANMLRPTLANTAQLSATLARIAVSLEQGKGTAGLLINDPRLYESMLLTSERLTEMVETLHRLIAKFEMDGQIKLDVPVGPFRHGIQIKVPNTHP